MTQTLASAPGGTVVTQYVYDANGNLTSVADPNGNVTTYLYDDFGRMIQQTSPVTGTTVYAYDAAGNLTSSSDANSAVTTRAYDALNRMLTAVSSRGSSETVSYTYDNSASGWFGLGRVSTMTDPTGSTTYRYGRRGELLAEVKTIQGAAYTTAYRYDVDGNRSSMTYPSGRVVNYAFDQADRPVSATSGATTLASAATYLPFGPLTSLTYGNGATKTMRYDNRYRVLENKLTGPAGTIADYNYGEDAVGNITQIHDALDPGWNRDFGYDDLNRLVTANTGARLWGAGTYSYDAMGNLLTTSLGQIPPDTGGLALPPGRGGAAAAGTARRIPHAESIPPIQRSFAYQGTTPKIATATNGGLDHTVSYDAAGNETQYLISRSYSPRNFMSAVDDVQEDGTPHRLAYGYDGRGIRVSRGESPAGTPGSVATRHYLYSADLQLLEVTNDDSANLWGKRATGGLSMLDPHDEFLWFGGQPLAQFGPARVPDSNVTLAQPAPHTSRIATTSTGSPTTLYYTFTDHLGTPILQTDASATLVWRAEYDPYGNAAPMRTGRAIDQPLRFPGQELAMNWEGVEENYNIFRWYRGGWGRYTQSDPLGRQGDPNLYTYALGNPTRYIDPLGLKVYRCCTVADIPGNVSNFKHCWVKTETREAGLGNLDVGQPGGQAIPNNQCGGDPPFVQTQVVDHTGQSVTRPGTKCTEITDADEQCVNNEIFTDSRGYGTTQGLWMPWNQCNSFTNDVLRKCKKKKCTPRPSAPADDGRRYF